MTNTDLQTTLPKWVWAAAILGLAWNIFGLYQFAMGLGADVASLMAGGLTAEQAQVMLGYPMWMTVVFAIGVVGGTVGCLLFLARKSLAVPVFLASLIGYILLWIGDAINGVFAALGTPQVVILTMVVAIAAALWLLARRYSAALNR
jgi:hypothetical protein